ncbi:MAG: hypothetical protein PHS61_07405 [Candidatus Omnitrophica bacterium]|nr:hypothetical protein [Candidatus Omnitrophota bacterium]
MTAPALRVKVLDQAGAEVWGEGAQVAAAQARADIASVLAAGSGLLTR